MIVAVLSSLASTSSTFAKLLRGKLFIASPLLAVSRNEWLALDSNSYSNPSGGIFQRNIKIETKDEGDNLLSIFFDFKYLSVNQYSVLSSIKRISDLKERSERFAETLAAWNARETALMRLYIAFQVLDFKLGTDVKGNDGMGELWKVIVVAISKETPFGAAVVSEILKVKIIV